MNAGAVQLDKAKIMESDCFRYLGVILSSDGRKELNRMEL